jgi:predicted flap endonuclease-1-like 5' DNA nuclease
MTGRRGARAPRADQGELASFRELKGIGPATELRFHEAGIYT